MPSNGTHNTKFYTQTKIEHIATVLGGKKRGDGYQCHCPAHEDKHASLSVDLGDDGRLLLYCHAGCSFDDITRALGKHGITSMQLSPALKEVRKQIVATYDYCDEEGKLQYQTVRLSPKGFYQRRPDGHSGWINDLKGIKSLPYHLPEVIKAIAEKQPIYIVEGEKDADRLISLGLSATCNHGGAGKWSDSHSSYLKGASEVVILPDNDETGHSHAEAAASSLFDAGVQSIKIVNLPDLPVKGDVSDWLDAGNTIDDLHQVVDTAPLWTPEPLQPPAQKWRLLSASEVLTLPPVEWLIEGELPTGGLTVLYGASGSGKSFLALDYALQVAQQDEVVYIAGEGLSGYPDRLLAWRNHHKQKIDRYHLVDDAIPMLDEAAVREFCSAVVPLSPKLIVIDTLARCMLGGDENSAKDMGLFIHACNTIQRLTGAAVLVVHHTGKSRNSERGSSALRGGADSMIELSNDDGLISVNCTKSKDSEPFKTRYLRLVKVTTRDERDSCVLLPAEKVQISDELTDSQQRALEVLSWETFVKAGTSARILAEQARIPQGSIYRILTTLMKDGYVSQAKKGEPYYITEAGKQALEDAA